MRSPSRGAPTNLNPAKTDKHMENNCSMYHIDLNVIVFDLMLQRVLLFVQHSGGLFSCTGSRQKSVHAEWNNKLEERAFLVEDGNCTFEEC